MYLLYSQNHVFDIGEWFLLTPVYLFIIMIFAAYINECHTVANELIYYQKDYIAT